MGNNIQRLGETITKRISKSVNAAATITTEFGIVNDNLSITPDSLNEPIPQGDYLMPPGVQLQPEDRVLISWAGDDPVVTGPVSEERESLPITVTSDGEGNVTITF